MHDNKYENITVLHDDAYHCHDRGPLPWNQLILTRQQTPDRMPDNKYLLTAQNCSATLDDEESSSVTEDN